jgi:hypothetical protein
MRRIIIFLCAVGSILSYSGCALDSEESAQNGQTQSLTQTFEHRNYIVKLPQSWQISKDHDDDPTLYFKVKQQSSGGLFLSRFDKLEDLPADRQEITELRTNSYQVYKYSTKFESADGSSEAFVICFYIPDKNSGYEFVFVNNIVGEEQALEIARTFIIK